MDIYVVTEGRRVVGASTKLQGAELIKADEATRRTEEYLRGLIPADGGPHPKGIVHRYYYDLMTVTNIELRDHDD